MFIEKLTEVQKTVGELLGQLQSSEHDYFAAHLYQSRREYRARLRSCGQGNKAVDRCVLRDWDYDGSESRFPIILSANECQ